MQLIHSVLFISFSQEKALWNSDFYLLSDFTQFPRAKDWIQLNWILPFCNFGTGGIPSGEAQDTWWLLGRNYIVLVWNAFKTSTNSFLQQPLGFSQEYWWSLRNCTEKPQESSLVQWKNRSLRLLFCNNKNQDWGFATFSVAVWGTGSSICVETYQSIQCKLKGNGTMVTLQPTHPITNTEIFLENDQGHTTWTEKMDSWGGRKTTVRCLLLQDNILYSFAHNVALIVGTCCLFSMFQGWKNWKSWTSNCFVKNWGIVQ